VEGQPARSKHRAARCLGLGANILPVQGMTKTDVSGIGDAASLSGMQNIWTLSVKQGNNVIVLTVYGAKSPDQQRSSEESLARLALKHL
jgi:hypothetical protein